MSDDFLRPLVKVGISMGFVMIATGAALALLADPDGAWAVFGMFLAGVGLCMFPMAGGVWLIDRFTGSA